jgi:hypothetical protein
MIAWLFEKASFLALVLEKQVVVIDWSCLTGLL